MGLRWVEIHWSGIVVVILAALIVGATAGSPGRDYLNSTVASPPPLAGVTAVRAQPIPMPGAGNVAPPRVLPSRAVTTKATR
jgi:hypothetical protein